MDALRAEYVKRLAEMKTPAPAGGPSREQVHGRKLSAKKESQAKAPVDPVYILVAVAVVAVLVIGAGDRLRSGVTRARRRKRR
jgi:hypothetical protein